MVSQNLTISVPLRVFRHENLREPRCPNCDGLLVLHMPDMELPDRLIGVCEHCHAWFLLNSLQGLMYELPNEDVLDLKAQAGGL